MPISNQSSCIEASCKKMVANRSALTDRDRDREIILASKEMNTNTGKTISFDISACVMLLTDSIPHISASGNKQKTRNTI